MSRCLTAVARARAAAMTLYYEDVFDEDKSDEQRLQFVNELLEFIDRPPITRDTFTGGVASVLEPVTFKWASAEGAAYPDRGPGGGRRL